ncbi:MAG TPA: hypothetical protein VIN09_12405 [Chloroflexota bacterium]
MVREPWQDVRRVVALLGRTAEEVATWKPALTLLRRRLPGRALTVVATPDASATAERLALADVVLHPSPHGLLSTLPAALGSAERLAREQWALVQHLRAHQFDAAFVFSPPGESPYPLAYACYLAGIPVRCGTSIEFGGGVLTHWVKPLRAPDAPEQHHAHLVRAVLGDGTAEVSTPRRAEAAP